MSTPNEPGDKPPGPAGFSQSSGIAGALDRMRARREATGTERPTPATLPGETLAPGRTPPRGVLDTRDGGKSDAGADPDTPEDDDIFSAPEDPQPGAPEDNRPPAADEDDPILWEDDGTPVKKSEAKNGWMRRKDYSAKTAEVAQQRKTFEQGIAEAQKAREDYVRYLNTLQEAQKKDAPAMPDAALKISDPLGYQEKLGDYLVAQQAIRERDEEMRRVAQEHFETARKQQADKVAEEQRLMIETVPALKRIANDPAKLGKALAAYKSGARHYGYTDAELANLADHRAIRLLDDALRWRAFQRKQRGKGGNGVDKSEPSEPANVTLKQTAGFGGTTPRAMSADKAISTAEAEHKKHGTRETALALMRAKRARRGADVRR